MSGVARFDQAVGALLLGQPFFGQLLLKMDHVVDEKIPTLCVNKTQLRYNPAFLESLRSDDEVVFCVAHEVMHQAWQHLPRLESYIRSGMGPDGKEFDPRLFNMALDYPLNHALVVSRVGTAPTQFPICLDAKKYPETMSPEEVYCLLKQEQEAGGGGGGAQQSLDDHDAMGGDGDGDADGDGKSMGSGRQPITMADVLEAAQAHKAIRGELPAGIERLLGELRKPPQSPWRALRNFVTTSLPGRDATSWRRLQRRYAVRGIGMPGPTLAGAGRVGVVVDTSGSIGEDMLNLFAGHMAAIIDDAKPREVYIYWVDASVHRVDVVKNGSQLRAVMAKGAPGGGGTDMRKGVKNAEADKCDGIVVLTDGYTPFCDSTRPLIWAITTQVEASGNGRTIHI